MSSVLCLCCSNKAVLQKRCLSLLCSGCYLQAKKPPIDVVFFIYQRRQQLREAEANSSAMSVLARVRFEELKALGDELCLRVKYSQVRIVMSRNMHTSHSAGHSRLRLVKRGHPRQGSDLMLLCCSCTALQNELWQEVIKPVPSVGRLCNLGQEIQSSMVNANQCFAKQLAMNPSSIQTMRRYSHYLLEVCDGFICHFSLTLHAKTCVWRCGAGSLLLWLGPSKLDAMHD
jgi:hypothetical protein